MTEVVHSRLSESLPAELAHTLGCSNLFMDYGACVVRLHGANPGFVHALQTVYGNFPFCDDKDFADFHVRLLPGRGVRRVLRPVVRFSIDGVEPFEPFPADSALPLYEWGVNWCFGQRFNQYVLLHAGTLADQGRAIVMPAVPGSGKSTLTAAMMLSGFRLLSDEFGVLDPHTACLRPMLKPVALKNKSIEVIREFSSSAVIGPVFPKTRKGDVAHLAPDLTSVLARHESARPALVVFPQYRDGASLELTQLAPEHAFARLAFNSFNYALLGPVGFHAVADLVEACPAYALRYSRLDEAISCIRTLLEQTQ